ncbi:Toxin HigB-2 [Candidatus Promineifilum breve]|uniref:Toxin HigB-2 n=1 Tax=Candidatus Promineifilum breve TaxID=1806508 RepID=A0A160T237_9CHLR|nr:type II toxin-antitoxin system RelE/ParE family toxin [Candidatus Promineifilum breve]CUS03966.2 Toxin HigB-2 [Candidatus Promineifilum breve]
MVIVETKVFTRQIEELLTDEAYKDLQTELVKRPEVGVLIPGGGGLRKMRWGYQGQGKRGGVRVIYYWAAKQKRILMLFIYPKNVRDNLSPAQLRALRSIVEAEYQ